MASKQQSRRHERVQRSRSQKYHASDPRASHWVHAPVSFAKYISLAISMHGEDALFSGTCKEVDALEEPEGDNLVALTTYGLANAVNAIGKGVNAMVKTIVQTPQPHRFNLIAFEANCGRKQSKRRNFNIAASPIICALFASQKTNKEVKQQIAALTKKLFYDVQNSPTVESVAAVNVFVDNVSETLQVDIPDALKESAAKLMSAEYMGLTEAQRFHCVNLLCDTLEKKMVASTLFHAALLHHSHSNDIEFIVNTASAENRAHIMLDTFAKQEKSAIVHDWVSLTLNSIPLASALNGDERLLHAWKNIKAAQNDITTKACVTKTLRFQGGEYSIKANKLKATEIKQCCADVKDMFNGHAVLS